ncbi:AfsR/SARP family transcriptional regulator [Solicola gregarius]|uniref:Tetratricopeptide repeat protein n=1 Tax=Solicola gregarius TaxID=2908642 RepID=A0AA46TJC1_9ACTN|nr:BTAD domain-containing putative transcriptional regulator [Solicola gregarius]UYM06340.1 tetratricopeptide repeat protein [Solicola gregarius]
MEGEPAEGPVIEVGVLGTFRVRVDGRTVELSSDRLRVILAVLAMSAGRPVSVERLAEAAWGDELPNAARRTLQTYVHRLRSALGSAAIGTANGGYFLDTDPERVDALRFVRLIDGAAESGDRAPIFEALQLWRGDPFDGLESRYLAEAEAVHLRDRRLAVLQRRIDLDLADGRFAGVVAELDALLVDHRLHEPLWARLLRALNAAGRQAEALERYAQIRERIGDELGVDPGPELRTVHAELLAARPPEPAARPEAAPERLVPREVPVDIAGFTGRAQSMAALDTNLADTAPGRVALVAVHGAGGIGKTSLVVHWAHRHSDQFPDGQLYLNLRGFGPEAPISPASALDSLLRGLGVAATQIPPDTSARASLLRSTLSDRRVLVILDNARDADQVRPLLPGAGSSAVIITSRNQLRSLVAREGAARQTLDQLDLDESTALLTGSLDRAGVAYDPSDLRRLADRCGHLPLALAIAAEHASRQPHAGLAALIEELDAQGTRLDVLDAGDDAANLRMVFAWSYRAHDDDTARMFRLLGLQPSLDVGIGAAAALAGVSPVGARRHLDRLVDSNLLLQRQPDRYELHDLLHAYAAELCDEHDPASARADALDRYLGWYVHSAHNGWTPLRAMPPIVEPGRPDPGIELATFDTVDDAMAWFDAERHALTACVRFTAAHGRELSAYRLADLIQVYLRRRRAFDDLLSVGRLARGAAQRTGDTVAEAQMTGLLGIVTAEMHQFDTSADHLERALALFEEAGHLDGQQRTLVNLGLTLDEVGDAERAVGALACAVTINRRREQTLHTVTSLVRSLSSQAEVCVRLGRLDEAVTLSGEAIDLCRDRDIDALFEADAAYLHASALAAQGAHHEAIEHFSRATELFRSSRDRWFECVARTHLARSYQATEQTEFARSAARRALELFDDIGDAVGIDLSRTEIVDLLAGEGQSPFGASA